MQIQNPAPSGVKYPPLMLAYGFRPFFLLAGLHGTVTVIAWLAAYAGHVSLSGAFSPMLWHGHEMLFGFAGAVAPGFLLTAVPNWTQSEPVRGGRLALLVALWFAGRIAFCLTDVLPPAAVAAADLLLVPALGIMIGVPIFRSRQKRNYFFPVLLALLFAANLMIHLEMMEVVDGIAESGLYLAMYVYAMLLSLISGRIVPNFTASALRMRGENVETRISMPLELTVLVTMAAVAIADLVLAAPLISGALALSVAALLILRMRNWNTAKVLDEPLLWVLHLGAAWMAMGFIFLGLADLAELVSKSTAFHALSVGAIGTLAIAIMTRASLGHTGRPFVLAKAIPVAYLLVSLAALSRVVAPAIMPTSYGVFIMVAGAAWAAAFGIFTVVYWPILTRPRLDGRPG